MTDTVVDVVEFPESAVIDIAFKHRTEMIRLFGAIKKANSKLDIRQVPLSILSEDASEIIVYPTILLDLPKPLGLAEALYRTNFRVPKSNVFNSLRTIYETEMADKNKRRRWQNLETLLNRQEKTTVARYLRNHLKLSEKGLKDDEIRDIAQKIEHWFKPPDLIFAKTPQDYVTMFEVNTHTCMVKGSGHFNETTHELVKAGHFPSEWFHYNPHTQGIYIQKEGKTVARGFLVRKNATEKFIHFTNCMGSTPAFADKLEELLKRAGYKRSNDFWQVPIKSHFIVPPIEFEKNKYCPLPFHDVISCTYYMCYDEKENVFRFGPGDDLPNFENIETHRSPYDFKGFAKITDIKGKNPSFKKKKEKVA